MTMSENDEVIYHSSHSDNRQSMDNIHRLVTLERSQKLDLLIHLINNLSQSLVVCGPEGIGKTTLLNVLREHKQHHWQLFWAEGSAQLSFERLTEQCRQELSSLEGSSLAEKLSQLDQRQQKLVWIIDNAGELVPGLISALIQFAKPYDCLRLIFALTHDELHLKNSSDPEISECHLIEIPPLSQQHYTAFLQNLSAGQGAMISFNAINEGLVENLYRKTHGIPGKIIEELPRLSHYKTMSPMALGSTIAIIVALAVAGGLLYLNKPETSGKTALATDVSETLYKKQPVDVAVSTPVIRHEQTVIENPYLPAATIGHSPSDDTADKITAKTAGSAFDPVLVDNDQPQSREEKTSTSDTTVQQKISTPVGADETETRDKSAVAGSDETESSLPAATPEIEPAALGQTKTAVITTAPASGNASEAVAAMAPPVNVETPKPVKKEPAKKHAKKAALQGIAWLESRNPKHFTLQIMALSQLSGVKKLMQKYPVLQQKAQYFSMQRQGKPHYVIVLGDYPSRAAAEKMRKTLPKALAKAWIRSFKILQQQIRS